MANKWLSNLNPFSRENTEVKDLRGRLNAAIGEREDLRMYDAKFYDAEPSSFSGNGMYQIAGIDQTINAEQLQRLYATETWVYVAVNSIAKTVASLPIELQKKTTVKKPVTNSVTGQAETVNQDHWEDASGSKLSNVFNYPNKFATKTEFFMLLVIDLLTTGEYYVYLDSDQDLDIITSSDDVASDDPNSPFGRLRQAMASGTTPIKAMYRIPPSLIKPVPSEDNQTIIGYAMHAVGGSYAYSPAEMIHVKLPNPTAPLQGLSPLIPAMKPILLDRFTTEHMIRFYKSGARLGGVIKTAKDMTKDQLGRFQRSFENNYTGRQNHHRTLILPPGMEYAPIEQNPAETALLDFCKYNREAILAVYNVPPIKAGIMDKANYANALVQLKQFFTDSVMPLLSFVEDGFNLKTSLMPDSRFLRFKFDLTDVDALKDNFKEKAEAAKFMIDGGLTVNEVRARVWDVGPIPDGEKCKVIEDIKAGKTNEGGFSFLNAPKEGVEGKEQDPADSSSPDQGLLAGMPGPMVTQIMNILGRVSRGRLTADAALHMMNTIHGVPTAICERILNLPPKATAAATSDTNKDAVTQTQPDAAIVQGTADTTMTYSQRVAQLIQIFMEKDKLPLTVAVGRAVEQAKTEGYSDAQPGDKDGVSAPAFVPTGMAHDPGHPLPAKCDKCKKDPCECPPSKNEKPSLEEYISHALGKLDQGTEVTEEFMNELKDLYSQAHGEPVTNKEGEIAHTQVLSFGWTKEQGVEYWKSFIEKTDPMIAKRHAEVVTFFKNFKALVLGHLGTNVKQYGLMKVRTKADEDEILSGPEYAALLKQYIAEADKALKEATEYGFADTLTTFKFSSPDEKATEALQKYLADKIKGIGDTTLDQMRDVLSTGFAANLPIAAISQKISEKFTEIESGRAQTIARTETLTAVSMGRELKRQEWQQAFPDGKLKKGWVSSADDRVRDSHADLDGVFIDADDTFDNGCKYPRDPDGEAEEVINCRCTDITVASEDAPKDEDDSE